MRTLSGALLVLGVFATAAYGDEVDAKNQARAHYRAGTAFFEAGDYARAIEEYGAAYKLLPLPDLLFNLAQAQRLKGDNDAAAKLYRQYLETKPNGPVADEARARLKELEAQIAADKPTGPSRSVSSPTDDSKADQAIAQGAGSARPATEPAAAKSVQEQSMAATPQSRRDRRRFISLEVGGGAALATAAVLSGLAIYYWRSGNAAADSAHNDLELLRPANPTGAEVQFLSNPTCTPPAPFANATIASHYIDSCNQRNTDATAATALAITSGI